MSFSDHKITAFTHRIADLPDQPNLPADELKARFDSSPEELRESVNGICDDADRLKARVEGIVAETFGDAIDKEMLSTELAAELDAKATQTALAAEQTAREGADTALSDQIDTLTAQKCEIYVGSYTGNGQYPRTITLGFQPKAVIVASRAWQNMYVDPQIVNVILPNRDAGNAAVTTDGFSVQSYLNRTESEYNPYRYIAFK